MSNPRAFVSFDFDNNECDKMLFIGQAKNLRTPFAIQDWSSKTSLPQTQWEKLIQQKINQCNLMIVLVGRNMRTAKGVEKEIMMANNADLPFFGVYVNGAHGLSPLPAGLNRNRTIDWKWDDIAKAIQQVMKEGKNLKL
jgi:MTH538 TIR-like domain (DUF1863)